MMNIGPLLLSVWLRICIDLLKRTWAQLQLSVTPVSEAKKRAQLFGLSINIIMRG